MNDRRTPRAHLQSSAIGEEEQDKPPCSPLLVEWLERQFPITLAPPNLMYVTAGLDGAVNIAMHQAEQRGRQQVIDRLRNLIQQEA